MAVGDRCQLIMVFPELDIVAVVTARNYCSFSKMTDDISATVKSDTALPPNPAGATLLAEKIRDIPRSRQNPKILWGDDAKIIGDGIAIGCPVFRNVLAQEH